MDMIGNKVIHKVMMHGDDGHYAAGLVNGARMMDFFGDVGTELMTRIDGDGSLFLGYETIRFTQPIHVGDVMEYHGWIEKKGNTSYTVRFEVYKVMTWPDDFKVKRMYLDAFVGEPNLIHAPDSAIIICDPPILCGHAKGTMVITKDCQRGPQDKNFAY